MERVEAVRTAMAEKFDSPRDFFEPVSVVSEDGSERLVIMLTSGIGIDKGSWNEIFDPENEEDFMIDIDGLTVDTRAGMTWGLYQAWIAREIARGTNPLPDSKLLQQLNGDELQGTTWLNGDEAWQEFSENAPLGVVYTNSRGDFPMRGWDYTDGRRGVGVRFRPAVEINPNSTAV